MSGAVWITRPLTEHVLEEAAKRFASVTVRQDTVPCTQQEMIAALGQYDVILPTLGDAFSAEVFAKADPLRTRLIANFGVGYNHIDAEAARRAGVAVTNTPGAVTDATADIALTLMLMSARRAGEGERMIRAGQWQGWHPTQMLGLHMTGRRVGIVGMGRIGSAIARRCHFGFGMEIAYFTRSPKELDFPAEACPTLQALAASVDFLVIAAPGSAETHHLIGAEVLAAMQPHARLINIARGDIVDETALIDALETGQIAGAGLDVYEFEPKVPAGLIRDDVVLLPHLGTAAENVRTQMGLMALDNISAHFANRALPNAV